MTDTPATPTGATPDTNPSSAIDWEAQIEAARQPTAGTPITATPPVVAPPPAAVPPMAQTQPVAAMVESAKRMVTAGANLSQTIITHNGMVDGSESPEGVVHLTLAGLSKAQIADEFVKHPEFWGIIQQASSTVTNQVELLTSILTELKQANKLKLVQPEGILADKTSTGVKADPVTGAPKVLTGQKATLAVAARLRGLKKVHLPSSGFYVSVRPMSLAELSAFTDEVKDESRELGRMLGGFFYLISDVYIKQKFMELFEGVVTASNLIGWQEPGVLTKNISLQDYDTLVHAMCVQLYPKGHTYSVVCMNQACKHVTPNIHVDLNRVKVTLTDMIPKAAIEFLQMDKQVTPDDLTAYRTQLLSQTEVVSTPELEMSLRVPTMDQYITSGKAMIGTLAAVMKETPTYKNETEIMKLSAQLIRSMAPWVSELRIKDMVGNIAVTTTEEQAIQDAIEMTAVDSTIGQDQFADDAPTNSPSDKIDEFIRKTKLSFFCYTATECPVCKRRPSLEVDEFVPMDVQTLFFILAWRQLGLTRQ